MSTDRDTDDVATQDAEGEKQKLELDVKIDRKSACERHVTVTIPRADIDRYLGDAFGELMPKAEVPGFRQGRAPRKLVERKFRKEISDQIKSSLIVDSLGQLSDEQQLTPISEPDFDPASIVIPDDGPMTFEFDIEVRPEFDLPKWKGLSIDRPVREFSDADIDAELQRMIAKHGKLVPHDGPAKAGDYVTANVTFTDGDEEIHSLKEQAMRIRPALSFRDGRVEKFDKLMKGVKAGETRVGEAKITDDAPKESLRGKTIKATFEVLEVKKLELPELTPAFLEEMGGFQSEAELRDAIRDNLQRRLQYEQQQRARQQILASLTVAADWDLPPGLLKRQAGRELERSILELRRSGFSDDQIRGHINEISQNSQASTARSLKEHFILERIAEEEKIEDTPEDYDTEIDLIARQSSESPRRVRAHLEKRGLMDALRNQIVERKAIELIMASAKFKEVPYELEAPEAEALDEAAGGEAEEERENAE
ncbi:MAG TPA: trigger factor [Pirellulales bacterium]|jgi:trigger factor|nr:trigger factor [Pirellulales bacterium]